MPYLSICTNTNLENSKRLELMASASRIVASQLNKPEAYVRVSFTAGQPLILAGTAEPAAYLELKSIGLPEAKRDSLCAGLTDSVSGFCGIAKDRVFLVMADVSASLWGYDGKTIG